MNGDRAEELESLREWCDPNGTSAWKWRLSVPSEKKHEWMVSLSSLREEIDRRIAAILGS